MATIFETVTTALNTLSPAIPFALKPYLTVSGNPLPDTFIDYQLIISTAEQHADDAEQARSYLVQVTIWSVTGLVALPDVDTAMISAGFLKSDERQLPKDPDTGHYGLAKDFVYI